MDIKKYFEEQKIEPVQDRKDGMDYWTNYELFTYNDLIECMDDLVKKMSVMRSCTELCDCAMPDPIDPFAEVDKDTCRKCNNLIA